MAELTGVQKQYILHWGEMGTRWGINRTVAQIHALLYLSPKALPAEVIAETLSVARSNVSTSIRELETWGGSRSRWGARGGGGAGERGKGNPGGPAAGCMGGAPGESRPPKVSSSRIDV